MNDYPKITVGVDMKLNLGNYESASVSMIVSGLPANAPEREIDELLDTGKVAYTKIVERLKAKAKNARTRAMEWTE